VNAPLDEVRRHFGGPHLISGNRFAHQWGRANGAKQGHCSATLGGQRRARLDLDGGSWSAAGGLNPVAQIELTEICWRIRFAIFGKVYNHNVSVASFKHLRGILEGISGAFTPRRRRSRRASPLNFERHSVGRIAKSVPRVGSLTTMVAALRCHALCYITVTKERK
jgi:hypothetical protein